MVWILKKYFIHTCGIDELGFTAAGACAELLVQKLIKHSEPIVYT